MDYSKKNIKAVIFDMDGLILDSEAAALQAFREACYDFNYNPDLSVYMKCIGTNLEGTRRILTEGYGPEFPYEEIWAKWNNYYQKKIENNTIALKLGVTGLLHYLKEQQLPLGIATSTSRKTTEIKLTNIGLLSRFSQILCGDEVNEGKPSPEIYLKLAKKMEVPPCNCLVLEDSDNGIRSALAAGTNPIQVPDLNPPSLDILEKEHLILNSLEEVLYFLKEEWEE